MTLNTNITVAVNPVASSGLDLSTPADNLNVMRQLRWLSGNGADQANLVWHDSRSVAALETLTLTSGLTDAFGVAVNFGLVKLLYIRNTTAYSSANYITIGGTHGSVGGGLVVRSGGGIALHIAPDILGYTTSAATTITITPSGSTATYDIIIVGVASGA